jgi:hypothetical protein
MAPCAGHPSQTPPLRAGSPQHDLPVQVSAVAACERGVACLFRCENMWMVRTHGALLVGAPASPAMTAAHACLQPASSWHRAVRTRAVGGRTAPARTSGLAQLPLPGGRRQRCSTNASSRPTAAHTLSACARSCGARSLVTAPGSVQRLRLYACQQRSQLKGKPGARTHHQGAARIHMVAT